MSPSPAPTTPWVDPTRLNEALAMKPGDGATVNARAEAGVIARLGECIPDWCRITADGRKGWVRKSALWGVLPEELRE